MHVLAKASERWQRRNSDRRLQCKLTWDQVLKDLAGVHKDFGFRRHPHSKRALAYWLGEMESRGFIHRETKSERARDGRILYRLTTFSFGANGILWIKNFFKDGAALVSRSIVQKIAARFKSDKRETKKTKEQRAVDKSIHSAAAKPAPTKKTAALRRRAPTITQRTTRPSAKPRVRKGPGPANSRRKARTARARRRRRTRR